MFCDSSPSVINEIKFKFVFIRPPPRPSARLRITCTRERSDKCNLVLRIASNTVGKSVALELPLAMEPLEELFCKPADWNQAIQVDLVRTNYYSNSRLNSCECVVTRAFHFTAYIYANWSVNHWAEVDLGITYVGAEFLSK